MVILAGRYNRNTMEHIQHLSKDKKFKKILALQKPLILEQRNKVYLRLCSSIMSQQLSTKVAKVIYNRFLELFKGKEPLPAQILNVPFETLRGIGLSNSKTHYIRNVCEFF